MGAADPDEAPAEERAPTLPFFTVSGTVRREVLFQGGWAQDGELVETAVDATVGPGNADQQISVAVQGHNGEGMLEDFEEKLADTNERIQALELAVADREARIEELPADMADLLGGLVEARRALGLVVGLFGCDCELLGGAHVGETLRDALSSTPRRGPSAFE